MTTENWINVAMVIALIITAAATVLGPVLAVYAQVRMSQPKEKPTSVQENTWTFRIGWWAGAHAGRLVLVGLFFAASMLLIVVWRFPSGRLSALLIAFDVNIMSVQGVTYLFLKALAFVYAELNKNLYAINDALEQQQRFTIAMHNALWPPEPLPDVQQ